MSIEIKKAVSQSLVSLKYNLMNRCNIKKLIHEQAKFSNKKNFNSKAQLQKRLLSLKKVLLMNMKNIKMNKSHKDLSMEVQQAGIILCLIIKLMKGNKWKNKKVKIRIYRNILVEIAFKQLLKGKHINLIRKNFALKTVFNNINNSFKNNVSNVKINFLNKMDYLSLINGFVVMIAIKSLKIIYNQNGKFNIVIIQNIIKLLKI